MNNSITLKPSHLIQNEHIMDIVNKIENSEIYVGKSNQSNLYTSKNKSLDEFAIKYIDSPLYWFLLQLDKDTVLSLMDLYRKNSDDEKKYKNVLEKSKHVNHDNIVNIYNIAKTKDDKNVCIMERCSTDMDEYIGTDEFSSKSIKQKSNEAIYFLHSLLKALQYIHELNISHNNINPSHILLDKKGNGYIIKLTNFSSSKDIETQDEFKIENIRYIDPSLFMNMDNITKNMIKNNDIYSVLMSIYELLFDERFNSIVDRNYNDYKKETIFDMYKKSYDKSMKKLEVLKNQNDILYSIFKKYTLPQKEKKDKYLMNELLGLIK